MRNSSYVEDFLKIAKQFKNAGLPQSIRNTKDCLFYAKAVKEMESFLNKTYPLYGEVCKVKTRVHGEFNYEREGELHQLTSIINKAVINVSSFNFIELASYDTGINPNVIFDLGHRGDIHEVYTKAIKESAKACKEIDDFFKHNTKYRDKYIGFKKIMTEEKYCFKRNDRYYNLNFSHVDTVDEVLVFNGKSMHYENDSYMFSTVYDTGKIKSPQIWTSDEKNYTVSFDSDYARKFYPELAV